MTADLFAQALGAHRAGDLRQAETLYRCILQTDEGHAGAWHFLGVVACQRGQALQSLEYLEKAITLAPQDAGCHLNRGNSLRLLGRLPEARAAFEEALRWWPDFPQAHNNLANVFCSLGDRARARQHWQRDLELQSDFPDVHANLAQTLAEDGRADEALAHAEQALRLQPRLPSVHLAAGKVHVRRGAWDAAAKHFHQVIALQPGSADAHAHLGHVLHQKRRLSEAALHLRRALELQPDSAFAHNEYAVVCSRQEMTAEALQHFGLALEHQPNFAEAHHNFGFLLQLLRRWPEAEVHFRQALQLDPHFTAAAIQLSEVLTHQGQVNKAADVLRQALAAVPDNAELLCNLGKALVHQGKVADGLGVFREALRQKPDLAVGHSCLLVTLLHEPGLSPEKVADEHRAWAAAHAATVARPTDPGHDRTPDRRLRVGYLSADFLGHVLAGFVEPILAHHDPARVESVCYAGVVLGDVRTARLQSLARHWRSVCRLSDAEVADLVRADAVDILVDLGGHTGSRLGVFAAKPAPVQVTYLGYPATTGLAAIDYRLTDAVADPPGESDRHTETLVRLPGCFCCYAPPEQAPEVGPLPALTSGSVTFASLHKLAKLNDRVLELWSQVLRAVPNSRLLVFRDGLQGQTAEDFRQRFAHHGVEPPRVELRHAVPAGQSWLTVYRDVDIALDSFPWSGHATACEGLWMGVPILTLRGDRHAGRMVSSVLTCLDLADWIASSPEKFVDRAVQWAGRLEQLAALRSGLRQRMRASPLCDGKKFTRQLEEAYRWMWTRWCAT